MKENKDDDNFEILGDSKEIKQIILNKENEDKENNFEIIEDKKEMKIVQLMNDNDDEDNCDYFEETKPIKRVKVILVGESGVGKTCIIYRYVHEAFNEDTLSTLSVSSEEKIVKLDDENKTEIKFDIWDTCGQEKFRNIASVFYKNAKAILLVYDQTSVDSFEKMKNFWYNDVQEKSDKDVCKFYFYLSNYYIYSYCRCFK